MEVSDNKAYLCFRSHYDSRHRYESIKVHPREDFVDLGMLFVGAVIVIIIINIFFFFIAVMCSESFAYAICALLTTFVAMI